jgi:hypothetical protein
VVIEDVHPMWIIPYFVEHIVQGNIYYLFLYIQVCLMCGIENSAKVHRTHLCFFSRLWLHIFFVFIILY